MTGFARIRCRGVEPGPVACRYVATSSRCLARRPFGSPVYLMNEFWILYFVRTERGSCTHFQMAAADDVHTESELRPVSQPHLHVVHAPPAAGLQFFPRGHVFRDPEAPARLSNISAT